MLNLNVSDSPNQCKLDFYEMIQFKSLFILYVDFVA